MNEIIARTEVLKVLCEHCEHPCEFVKKYNAKQGYGMYCAQWYAINSMESVNNDDCLPCTYAEIDYGNREDAEAILGSRWDDMNYQHYMER